MKQETRFIKALSRIRVLGSLKMMKVTTLTILIGCLSLSTFGSTLSSDATITANTANENRWLISGDKEIVFDFNKENTLPYSDNIEMAGRRVAGIISYSVDKTGKLSLDREIYFPQLHQFKTSESSWFHDYRAYLQESYGDNLLPKLYIDNQQFVPGAVDKMFINGMLNFTHKVSKNGLTLSRSLYPSMTERAFIELWTLKNSTDKTIEIISGNSSLSYEDFGAKGKYSRLITSDAPAKTTLKPGEELKVSIRITAKMDGEEFPTETSADALIAREKFIDDVSSSLILETPNKILNTLFAFSKIRGSESIFESELGLIHSPGGASYYVGIWANDQAEYISPFYPYLGYETGNISAINCYRAFAKEINPEYKNIRYSFEVEGLVKPFLKDRGDAAMIAYGAAHYAMALGDKEIANELWVLIEWCLEYCKRELNEGGVVKSESDEMEGRIETGTANLSTSSLYYGALNHAVDLGKSLNKSSKQLKGYSKDAKALKSSIESYFGATIEGLDTYKYYKEHKELRHWICLPLVVGIHNRKDATITALFDRLWTENGVHVEKHSSDKKTTEIFWDRGTLYAMRGTLIAGDVETTLDKLIEYSEKRLLGNRVPYVVEAYPEGSMAHLSAESGLYCRIFTEGLFGINPKGLNSLEITPRLPKDWDQMSLRKVKAFGSNFDIEIKREGKKIRVKTIVEGKVKMSKLASPGTTIRINL